MLEHLGLFLKSIFEVNYWNYSRAAGIMAYLFVWLAAISGLLSKAKILPWAGSVSILMEVHRKIACFGFYFIIFHALILSYDDYIKLKVDDLLIPFRSSYQFFNMSMGILAFYGTILVIGSMFFLGDRAFRYWHLLTYPVYFLASHGPFTSISMFSTVTFILFSPVGYGICNHLIPPVDSSNSLIAASTGFPLTLNWFIMPLIMAPSTKPMI